MIVILPQIISKSFSAVTIYPFIFLKHQDCKKDHVLINHELIHIRQQKELFWLVFFVWYLAEYLIKWAYYRNSYTAYRNISFEREAYTFENDLDYLSRRRFFAFFRFVRR